MEFLNGILTFFLTHPKTLIGLAIGGLIAARIAMHMGRMGREDLPGQIDDDAAARFEIGVREDDPELELAAEISTDLGKLIDAGRWDLVHSLLAAWERDRAATPFGTMFHRLGVERAMAPFVDIERAIAETGRRPTGAQIDAIVADFDARAAAEPLDHIAAALAARAHIAAGLIARGNGSIEELSARDLRRMADHYTSAERRLAQHAFARSSVVAEARYFVCLGLETGSGLIRQRFAEWIAIDPDDVAPYQVHGVHLLPRWFGDLDEVEREARHAAEAMAPRRGAAGYVIFHGGIMSCSDDGETLQVIDPDLFVRAALDRARTAGSQWGVNRMTEFVLRAMLDSRAEARQIYRDGLIRLLHDHLRVLIPAAWSSPIDDARWELARLFKADLEDGARVRVGALGIEILPPEPEATVPA